MAVRETSDRRTTRRVEYRWWMGWRPLVVVTVSTFAGFAVGNALAVPAGYVTGNLLGSWAAFTICGFVLGVLAWVWGTRAINGRYEARLSAFLDESRDGTVRSATEETETAGDETIRTLIAGAGSKPLVDAHERYSVATFVLGERLSIHESGFDMVEQRGDTVRTVELPYDRIEAVRADRDESTLTITMDDAETFSYGTLPERTDVLSELAKAISAAAS